MTEPKDNAIPDLDALAARYRRHTAPPGFTARVLAQIDRQPRSTWILQPRWALAAAVVLVVIISLPLLRDARPPATMARTLPETQVLAAAAGLLARSDRSTQPSPAEIPDVMSVQSIADIPDPFS